MLRYLEENKIKCSEWIKVVFQNLDKLDKQLDEVFESFDQETVGELWDSEEELINYYSRPENYRLLLEGKRGSNVIFSHRVWVYSDMPEAWVKAVFSFTRDLVMDRIGHNNSCKVDAELESLEKFIIGTARDCYFPETLNNPVNIQTLYDIPAWLKAPEGKLLQEFALSDPFTIALFHTDDTKRLFSDGFNRFGTDRAGLVKLIQRLAGRAPIRSIYRMHSE